MIIPIIMTFMYTSILMFYVHKTVGMVYIYGRQSISCYIFSNIVTTMILESRVSNINNKS